MTDTDLRSEPWAENDSRPAENGVGPGGQAKAATEVLDAIRSSRRRRFGSVVLALIVGAGIGAVAYAAFDDRAIGSAEETEEVVTLVTVAAETRDLATFVEYDGSLGFSESDTVTSATAGTFTFAPEAGTDLVRGDVVYEVDSEPVALFYGDLPSWRLLDDDSEDGRDVAQLEANLWALGYTVDLDDGNGPYLTVDEEFDWATAYAVEQWETDLGLAEPDGTFETDAVVYLPGEIRVDEPVSTGSAARQGATVFTAVVTTAITDVIDEETTSVTGQERQSTERVTLEVATSEQENFVLNSPVDIELSDGRMATGVISEIGEVARRLGNGANAALVVDVAIDVTEAPDGGLLEGPVLVSLVEEQSLGAVAVPVRSLVALAEGGFAVEVDDGSSRRLVGVETGVFADGWVEVTGVEAGTEVVVPS